MAHGGFYSQPYIAVSGAALNATAKAATFNGDKIYLHGDYVGIAITTASSSGTSPTLDVKVQSSFDDGSTWIDDYPDDANSATQAALAQITGDTSDIEFWPAWYRSSKDFDGNKPCIRFVFTIGGTNPSFTITARVIQRTFAIA